MIRSPKKALHPWKLNAAVTVACLILLVGNATAGSWGWAAWWVVMAAANGWVAWEGRQRSLALDRLAEYDRAAAARRERWVNRSDAWIGYNTGTTYNDQKNGQS